MSTGRRSACLGEGQVGGPRRSTVHGFVWRAEVGTGFMRFAGADGHHAPSGGPRDSWTKFWLHSLVPLARIGTSPDHARAAATRNMMEAVWAPARVKS